MPLLPLGRKHEGEERLIRKEGMKAAGRPTLKRKKKEEEQNFYVTESDYPRPQKRSLEHQQKEGWIQKTNLVEYEDPPRDWPEAWAIQVH